MVVLGTRQGGLGVALGTRQRGLSPQHSVGVRQPVVMGQTVRGGQHEHTGTCLVSGAAQEHDSPPLPARVKAFFCIFS